MPHAHWTIVTIFTVSQADAGASLRKSVQRILGTLAGGLAGILVVIALADLPVLYVPALAALAGAGIFASLTTAAPYVMLLGTITFVLVTFFPPGGAGGAVDTGLLRILAVTIGVACGTAAQLLLWPDDPEARLRQILASRLRSVDAALRAIARGARHPAGAAALAADDLTVPLDLLANAEARHPSLRRRHTEQLALIVEVDRLRTTAVWLAGAPADRGSAVAESSRRQLEAIADECARLGAALDIGRPPAGGPPPDLDEPGNDDLPALAPALRDMRLALGRVGAALGFLDADRAGDAPALDGPARTPLLTPAFSLENRDAVALAVKASLVLVIGYVAMHALDWPALLTAGVTAVIVAQTSFGAAIQKSVLRLAGAALGGALGIAVVLVAMPNIDSLAGLSMAAGLGYGIAAWITAGSSRISYMGIQAGMAFAIAVTDPSGPTTDLAPARDRVLGIAIGVLAMLLVDATLWPARARVGMWTALGRTLSSIARLARLGPEPGPYRARLESAVHLRSAVYRDLAATLRLAAESEHEPDARAAQQEREWVRRLTAHAQAVFLAVLALIRHRMAPGVPAMPAPVHEAMRQLGIEVAEALESLAGRLGGRGARPLPDLAGRLAALEALVPPEGGEPPAVAGAVALGVAERDHVAIARHLVEQLAILGEAIDAASRVRPS
jgi:uncharacterized membrane protein YccC